ncbi:MFS transporter [Microbacterium sp. No. 7]|uniref:MFS transporter n=1 Tax=Microbacterium sp. No. 7 TaxID=1714373 RepID=UPI0006ED1D0B|nr:MFS transporter [Microbacterium sp. No. 7]ALJ21719.1 hypothetical protein AOA12_18205 [Microbacterium sp. No. 7]
MSGSRLKATTARGAAIDARLDALPRVPLGFVGSLGLLVCYFSANYEISVFALVGPSLLVNFGLAVTDLGVPVFWNLAGYAVGAYLFGAIADRFGRQKGLLATVIVLAAGSALSGLAWDLASFTFFRFVAGAGMGAVLAICSTYIGELAPAHLRGKYLAKIYTVQAILLIAVSFASLWVLENWENGWRFLLAFGGIAVLVVFALHDRGLPESPRWLAAVGRIDRAERVTDLLTRGSSAAPSPADESETEDAADAAPADDDERRPLRILATQPSLGRMAIILTFWLVYYLAAYGFLSYTPLILEGLGIAASDSLLVTVLGRLAAVVTPLAMIFLIERVERRTLIIQGTLMIAAGLLLLFLPFGAVSGTLGVFLVTLGIGWSVTPAYIYMVEIFPTRARGTAASISEGVGHLGGAVAPFVVLPILVTFGASTAVWVLAGAALLAGLVVRFGPRTRGTSISEAETADETA